MFPLLGGGGLSSGCILRIIWNKLEEGAIGRLVVLTVLLWPELVLILSKQLIQLPGMDQSRTELPWPPLIETP